MRAILAKTTTDRIKSRILSNEVSELVFEVYMSPTQFANLIEAYEEEEFNLRIGGEKE